MPSAHALGIFSGNIVFVLELQKNLWIFLEFFHGEGPNSSRHLLLLTVTAPFRENGAVAK